jgi:multimeric flavodoxin WrbA
MNKKRAVVVLGTSGKGEAIQKAINMIFAENAKTINLSECDISYYDYQHNNRDDDFIKVMKEVEKGDIFVLATPVYWYTMSAIMKVFVDRFTDLLRVHRDTLERLQNKPVVVITSYGSSLPRGFEDAFEQTCEYLGMKYSGCFYYYAGTEVELQSQNEANAEAFKAALKKRLG